MSNITKKALENSLKKILLKKSLNKITISDITNDCGINRMTFYYHFSDIYNLIEWCCIEDAKVALQGKKTYETWQQGFYQVFEVILENKPFIMNVYNSVNIQYIESFLYKLTYNLIIGVVNEKSKGITIKQEDKEFIANFYKYGFVGLILDWIKKDMQQDPKDIINKLSTLIHNNIVFAIDKYNKLDK